MRKPTERLSPLASSSRLRTAFSRPGSTVKTRKIAASVSGLRTACGWAAFTSRRTLRNRTRATAPWNGALPKPSVPPPSADSVAHVDPAVALDDVSATERPELRQLNERGVQPWDFLESSLRPFDHPAS